MRTLSLELSKRLHELGIVVESEYFWWFPLDEIVDKGFLQMAGFIVGAKDKYCSAPTFEELWAVMPMRITGNFEQEYDKRLMCGKGKDGKQLTIAVYVELYQGTDLYSPDKTFGSSTFCKSPTEAAGMLLIWLAENGHVDKLK